MVCHSVIIPQRDRADDVRRQLPQLAGALESLGQAYEIIVVDDGSTAGSLRLFDKLLAEHHALRLVRLDQRGGASLALANGIEAARGEVIIASEPGDYYPATQLPQLVKWLDRADFVAGRRRRFGWSKFRERLARVPRGVLLGLDSHDGDCLFWAARREALADVHLLPGMARYLAGIVAHRGFRVCETYVEHGPGWRRLDDPPANPGDLLAAWWACRRWRPRESVELSAGQLTSAALKLVGAEAQMPEAVYRSHLAASQAKRA
jgi:glycosyltransferase involved in cell wall biosynthesis